MQYRFNLFYYVFSTEEIEKPSMPKLPMSAVVVNHHPCKVTIDSALHDVCTSMLGANARSSKPGVSKGGDFLIQVDNILITEEEKIIVSYFPNHPLQKRVQTFRNDTKHTSGKSKTQYQLYLGNEVKFHCSEKEDKSREMGLESLHYLGVGTHDNVPVRKWAAATQAEQRDLPQVSSRQPPSPPPLPIPPQLSTFFTLFHSLINNFINFTVYVCYWNRNSRTTWESRTTHISNFGIPTTKTTSRIMEASWTSIPIDNTANLSTNL